MSLAGVFSAGMGTAMDEDEDCVAVAPPRGPGAGASAGEDAAGRLLRDAVLAAEQAEWQQASSMFARVRAVRDEEKVAEMHAQALLGGGRVFDAVRAAESAAAMAPRWAPAHATLAAAREELGEIRLAEEAYAAAVALDGADADAAAGLRRCRELLRAHPRLRTERLARERIGEGKRRVYRPAVLARVRELEQGGGGGGGGDE